MDAYEYGEINSRCNTNSARACCTKKQEIAARLAVHTENIGADCLIKERYPMEPDDVYHYRCKNLPKVTCIFFKRVATALSRIRQARDFGITGWNKSGLFPDFENFCLKKYPATNGSVVDWVFNDVIECMLGEPNAVIVSGYEDWFSASYEQIGQMGIRTEPVVKIFRSKCVKYYKRNKLCVIELTDIKEELIIVKNEYDRYSVWRTYSENGVSGVFELTQPSGFSTFPAMVLGGFLKNFEEHEVYDSFVSAAIPALDKITQTISEEDLIIKENIHSILVMIGGPKCTTCKGEQFTYSDAGKERCKACNGSGVMIAKNASAIMVLQAPKEGVPYNQPFPNMTYVSPGVEALNAITANIDRYWNLAYSAINFDLISQVPLAISGEAKAQDRQEMNAFLFKIASHVINGILDPLINITAELLYMDRAYDERARQDMVPSITIPRNFNNITGTDMSQELVNLRSAKVDAILFASAELEAIEVWYANQPEEKQIYRDILLIDPCAGIDAETKLLERGVGGIRAEDYYLSINCARIVKDMYLEVFGFADMPFTQRKSMVEEQAAKEFPIFEARERINNAVNNDFSDTFASSNTVEISGVIEEDSEEEEEETGNDN